MLNSDFTASHTVTLYVHAGTCYIFNLFVRVGKHTDQLRMATCEVEGEIVV